VLFVLAPRLAEYVPGQHGEHAESPAREAKVPAGQPMHAIAPCSGWYVPMPHSEQFPSPTPVEKVPA
jgi:hypothetical protein